jgi:hypothetical protein
MHSDPQFCLRPDRRDTAGGAMNETNGMEAKDGGRNARREVGGSEGRRERGAGGGSDLSSVLTTR